MACEQLFSSQQLSSLTVRSSHYTLDEIEVPKPQGYQALVKIGAAGLCHTDMMMFTGEFKNPKVTYPVTGSHEPAGTVVALGDTAEQEKIIELGTRVAGLLPVDICCRCKDL